MPLTNSSDAISYSLVLSLLSLFIHGKDFGLTNWHCMALISCTCSFLVLIFWNSISCYLFNAIQIVMDDHQRPDGIPVTRFTLHSIYALSDDEKLQFEYESGNTNIVVSCALLFLFVWLRTWGEVVVVCLYLHLCIFTEFTRPSLRRMLLKKSHGCLLKCIHNLS